MMVGIGYLLRGGWPEEGGASNTRVPSRG